MRSETVALPDRGTPDALLRGRPGDVPRDRYPWRPAPDASPQLVDAVRDVPADRDAVVSAVRAYNEGFGNAATDRLCGELSDPRAVVVVTGQQPGVFGGPLMLFAKAATAVLVARDLARALDVPVVPVFWNHSEDHDVEEVRSLTAFRHGSPVRLAAPLGDGGVALEALRVDEELLDFARGLLEELGHGERGEDLLPAAGEPFPLWTSRVLLALLGGLDLLVLEPRLLRPFLGPLFGRAVEEAGAVEEALAAGTDAMAGHGFEPQIRSRGPGQLFELDAAGRRRRLTLDERWLREGTPEPLGTEELTARARSRPEGFSPTVVLRPVAQQVCLPVLVQVVGPAETAYFGQLPEVFQWAGRPLPALVPRLSLTVLRAREQRVRKRLGLDGSLLLGDPDAWPAPPEPPRAGGPLANARRRVEDALLALRGEASDVAGPLRRLEKRVRSALDDFSQSVAKQEEHSRASGRRQVHHLKEWVRPRGRPQERELGPLVACGGADPRRLGSWLSGLDPWDFRHRLMTLDEEDER